MHAPFTAFLYSFSIKRLVISGILPLITTLLMAQATKTDSAETYKPQAKDSIFRPVHTVGVSSSYTAFNTTRFLLANGLNYKVQLKKLSSIHQLSIINTGSQTADLSWQHEIYTIPFHKVYYYLFYSLSNSEFIPKISPGGSFFVNAPAGFEPNAGYRYMLYKNGNEAHIFNVGLGKYLGSFLFNYKAYFVLKGNSVTHSFSLRKYFKDVHFVELRTGFGATISEVGLQNGTPAQSSFISLGTQLKPKPYLTLNINAGYEQYTSPIGTRSIIQNIAASINYTLHSAKKNN